jgi:hypothetical protein
MDVHTIVTLVVLPAACRSTLIEFNLCYLKHTKNIGHYSDLLC